MGCNSTVHDNQREHALVIAASLLHGGVQGGCTNHAVIAGFCGDVKGVGLDELCRCLCGHSAAGGGHAENTLQNRQQHGLLHVHLVVGNLTGHVVHEVHTSSDVLAEVAFSPRIHAGSGHETLLIGGGTGCSNVSCTGVVLAGPAINPAKERNAGIQGTGLVRQGRTCILVAANRTGLCQFGLGDVRNTVNVLTKRRCIETLGIKFCHGVSFPFANFIDSWAVISLFKNRFRFPHPDFRPDMRPFPNTSFWTCPRRRGCHHHRHRALRP